jgi:hypothetical protein
MTIFHRKLILDRAIWDKVPAIYPYRIFAVEGGLIAYGQDVRDQSTEPQRM